MILTAAAPLTASDLAGLRSAYSVMFVNRGGQDGHDYIRAITDSLEPGGEDTGIAVAGAFTSYRYSHAVDGSKPVSAVAVHMNAQHVPAWQTIVRLLQPEDSLMLSWVADVERNEYMRLAGLHHDQLKLLVYRGQPTRLRGPEVLTFDVAHVVCPDGIRRMIQFA
jgi:hypothetical protein